jgi:hypothetical protein
VSNLSGVPKAAQISINDMLDCCAKIQPGQEVVLVAQIDGLYGGNNMVDQEAVSWVQSAIQQRGANATVLWIDEVSKPHAWRFPPVIKAAISACDVMINYSLDMEWEELTEFSTFVRSRKMIMMRNFATTAPLLCTSWAQTPYELTREIRFQISLPFKDGVDWSLVDDNGTNLSGVVQATNDPNHPGFTTYSLTREEAYHYRPWPEWMHPPVRITRTNGIFVFDRMLSWWSRYIGIPPYFKKPIQLTVQNNCITMIEGGDEADALRRFLDSQRERLGDGVYGLNMIHSGVHPQASVSSDQCPNILYRRLIDHSHTSNIHVHIGAPPATANYPYWMHITGDVRSATFKVGDTTIHDSGHLTLLDHPAVRAVAAKYPNRPTLEPIYY